MPEESESKKLFNRLKEATANVTQMTREQVGSLQEIAPAPGKPFRVWRVLPGIAPN